MSGGHFDYRECNIDGIACEINEIVSSNDSTELNRWGTLIGCGFKPEVIAQFREAVSVLRKASVYAHRIDYLLSGDDGEESFLRRLAEDLDELERRG